MSKETSTKRVYTLSNTLVKDAIVNFTICALESFNQPEVIIPGKKDTKKWMNFNDYVNKPKKGKKKVEEEIEKPVIKLITPIAISEPVINSFCLLFDETIALIQADGKLHHENPITKLINTKVELPNGYNIINIMHVLTTKKDEFLSPMMLRNFNFEEKITIALKSKFKDNLSLIDPKGSSISQLYLDFIKVISYFLAYKILSTQKRLTFTYDLLKSILYNTIIIGGIQEMPLLIKHLDSIEVIKKAIIKEESENSVEDENSIENENENENEDENEDEDENENEDEND